MPAFKYLTGKHIPGMPFLSKPGVRSGFIIAGILLLLLGYFIFSRPLENTDIIALVSIVVALISIGYSAYYYNGENKAREEANKNAGDYRFQLETKPGELKLLNEELLALRQIEKFAATGRIARTIAHEVRNPLTNISLAAEQLAGSYAPGTENAMLLDMISRNTVRINQLVTELLQSTRFAQLKFEKVDINQLLDDTLAMATDRIELNHVTIRKNYSREPCQVEIDPGKMKLGLLNIIMNAIEAMEKNKGVLTLITSKQSDKCVVEITDNGKGMDEEAQQKIFEPYFTGKHKGTGLGLTNTQNIILNHKGTITVKSRVSGGTTFFITLNLVNNTDTEPA